MELHLHEGLFLDPVMRNLEAFLESSQATSLWRCY